jgi:glutamine synthetase
VRLERYIKDMLIEAHTLREMVDTMVLPAAFTYSSSLIDAAAKAKSAGIKGAPQVEAANGVGKLIKQVQTQRAALEKLITKADHMHDDIVAQAQLLTGAVADAMASTRAACDALEGAVDDECWPLPKYREMLFPV